MNPQIVYVNNGPNISRDRLIQQALCTCPWCNTVWQHVENPGRSSYDLQRTREQLGNPRDVWDCPACGGKSNANALREKREKFTRLDLLQR